jgi:hypothetical protein
MKKAMYAKALEELVKEEHYVKVYVHSYIGVVYNLMGNRAKAVEILEKYKKQLEDPKLSQKDKISYYGLAVLCFSLGEDDFGFDLLEEGYKARDPHMPYIKNEYLMDRVRSNQRFVTLLKKINLD